MAVDFRRLLIVGLISAIGFVVIVAAVLLANGSPGPQVFAEAVEAVCQAAVTESNQSKKDLFNAPAATSANGTRSTKPRIIYLTYGERCCTESKKRACRTALELGPFNECHALNATALDPVFRKNYEHILQQGKGGGYWIWKPYIILQLFNSLGPNDVLYYSDAGAVMLQNLQPLLDLLWEEPTGVLLFQLCHHRMKKHCKRDAFILSNTDRAEIHEKHQILASQIVLRKTDYAALMLQRWFALCLDERAVTDIPSQLGTELNGYSDHRHDQALLALVAFSMNYVAYRDISQFGELQACGEFYPSQPFHMVRHIPQLLNHDRYRGRRRSIGVFPEDEDEADDML